MKRPKEEPMNSLLCRAMYDMATIEHDLHGKAWVAAQDNFLDDERAYCAAAVAVRDTAYRLADARGEDGEELVMRDLHDLAERLAVELRYPKLRDVYERLAMVPAAR
jgi:hypothetical protein